MRHHRRARRRPVVPGLLVVAAVGLLAACSTSGGAATPRASGAAEPAVAPVPTVAPAGAVSTIGPAAEGATYDPVTDTLAVAVRNPTRLLLVDGTTLRIRHVVPLPGTVRHLQLAAPGGPVLVPTEPADELVEVDPDSGLSQTIRVGDSPHDAAEAMTGDAGAAPLIAAGNEFGRSVSVVSDGGSGGDSVLRTVGGFTQPGGVAGLPDDRVAVVDVGAFTLSTVDLDAGTLIERTAAGAGPTHVVALNSNTLAVADTRGDAVLLFQASPLIQLARIPLAGVPYGLAADQSTGTVWVTETATDTVVGLQLSGTTLRQVASYPTVQQPNTVAVTPDSHTVYVLGAARGQLQVIRR